MRNKGPIIATLGGITVLAGRGYFVSHMPPKPMTLAECRFALENSTEFHSRVGAMDETNRAAATETGAMRCVLDHDPETSSWSDEKKLAVVIHAYCEHQAAENYLIQAACESMAGKEYERVKKYGVDVLTTPAILKSAH